MTMDKVLWPVCLKNSAAIICWTVLACHFDKWWIALFGVFFCTSVDLKKHKDEGGEQNGQA